MLKFFSKLIKQVCVQTLKFCPKISLLAFLIIPANISQDFFYRHTISQGSQLMHFEEFERVEYKHNILFEVLFQARFPEIMRISQEEPSEFQEIVRKEGYPELVSDIPLLPSDIPKEIKKKVSTAKVFRFFSKEKDWEVSLAQNFLALTCHGNYKNYENFREKLETVLQIFSNIYEPSYFPRIGLRHKNVANKVSLPHAKQGVETYIPKYIFPELNTPIAADIETLRKISQFNDGEMKSNVVHVLSNVSGKFKKTQFTNEKSYVIDIDCYSDNRKGEMNDILSRCDIFKKLCWNIYQWSITDVLRETLAESGA